jgi:hypothetical protein
MADRPAQALSAEHHTRKSACVVVRDPPRSADSSSETGIRPGARRVDALRVEGGVCAGTRGTFFASATERHQPDTVLQVA